MVQFIIDLINFLIRGLGWALWWVVNLLPNSPFSDPVAPPGSIDLGAVAWVIPFPTMILHFALVVAAIGIYYAIRVVARWIKIARG